MAVEQATSLSPEIVVFMIIGKGSSSNGRQVFFKKICFFIFRLVVPPGARMKNQMTKSEVKNTKEEANLRIHVERAINRIKLFGILKGTILFCA